MYNILITNDDGYDSRGIAALVEVALNYGKVTVVAPEVGMSGKSHAITIFEPISVREISKTENLHIVACGGTPVDCVKVACDRVMDSRPTLLLSGINHGSNSNISVIYSGTMGAAREGALCGIPSVGFSLTSHDVNEDLSAVKHIIKVVLDEIVSKNSNPHLCLNVNVPTIPLNEIKGIKVCRYTLGYWKEEFVDSVNEKGEQCVEMRGAFVINDPDPKSGDQWAIDNNYAAIVPITFDTNDYKTISILPKSIEI